MAVGQITWEKFITSNNDARGVRYKFEDLSRQLFAYEFLSKILSFQTLLLHLFSGDAAQYRAKVSVFLHSNDTVLPK